MVWAKKGTDINELLKIGIATIGNDISSINEADIKEKEEEDQII